jgi:hypothetical protein
VSSAVFFQRAALRRGVARKREVRREAGFARPSAAGVPWREEERATDRWPRRVECARRGRERERSRRSRCEVILRSLG